MRVGRAAIFHTLEPVYDAFSRVLILGTMPSPRSRETGFYYNHPQNRFWRTLSHVLRREEPRSNEEKRAFLLAEHIALWDVLRSCEIEGASDASIQNPEPNELRRILDAAGIRAIFTTGSKAAALYRRYCLPQTGRTAIPLPSTSAANARMREAELFEAYGAIARALQENEESSEADSLYPWKPPPKPSGRAARTTSGKEH